MVQAWGMLVASGQVVAVALRDAVLSEPFFRVFLVLKAYSAGKQPTRVAGMSVPGLHLLSVYCLHPACIAQARKANSTPL